MISQNHPQSQGRTTFVRTILRQLVPNLGTIIVVAAMLFVYSAQAASDKNPEVPADPDFVAGSIPYQGTLTDKGGDPVNGTVTMTFRLYASPTGGTALWEETQSIEVNNGLFNAFLGSLTPISESTWEQPDLYLGVQIGSDNEMAPRELVSGLPVVEMALTVPDGSITSTKAALTHGDITGSGDVLTLTTTPQIIPSLSFSIDTTSPQVIQLSVTLDAATTSPECLTVLARPYIDDIPVGTLMTLGSPARATISSVRQIDLEPGYHTVSFKAHCEGDSGGIIMTGQSSVSYILFSQTYNR